MGRFRLLVFFVLSFPIIILFQNCGNNLEADSLEVMDENSQVLKASQRSKDKKIIRNISYIGKKCDDQSETCFDIVFNRKEKKTSSHFYPWRWLALWNLRKHIDKMGETYYKSGFAFASIGYRLFPKSKVSNMPMDVSKAIAYIQRSKNRFNLEKSIIISGHSAGAHIAAVVATHHNYLERAGVDRSAIKGLILLDGRVFDPAKLEKYYPGKFSKVSGERNRLNDLSPVYQIKKYKLAPPTLMLNAIVTKFRMVKGKKITRVPTQFRLLTRTFDEAGLPYRLQTYKKLTHMEYISRLQNTRDQLTQSVIRFARSVLPDKYYEKLSHQEMNIIYSPKVFDWRVYRAIYPDNKWSKEETRKHWKNSGIKNGRRAQSFYSV